MLTERQIAVLDWQTVEGADAWYSNAVAVFGADAAGSALKAKVAKYEAAYDAAADKRAKAIREAE